ncbi:BCCT family transporter [Photobacterium aphoticum]|uniref:BCCT transporter n=1 Tax=Photobacterium aphoticum TaxID=754436 RepID=A0A0J1GPS6_9GAMM|nr:BCCT family transporter [Photobacterium aphoticum]KLV01750.1 BCCT transporter [Photobacterium aphoticum]PSU58770.1 BCCT transporter [Photobacterium aphoticum]GHA32098.1 BCCT family transporter [Photobacterium aphoticum]
MKSLLRWRVFLPPMILLIAAVMASFIDLAGFLTVTTAINNWILNHFSWLFSSGGLLMVVTLLLALFTPLGRKRIGGEQATPMLTKWRWGAITICTTTAAGMLFWGTAEPLYHLYQPPVSLGMAAQSAPAAEFALSTMYLHWSVTPFAIYAVPALAFALAFYRKGGEFSLSSAIAPVLGNRMANRVGGGIDALAMFALVAGMASSLGTGALVLSSGVSKITGLDDNIFLLGVVIAVIMICFVASSVSGLQRGIARLSTINAIFFVTIAVMALVFGPTLTIIERSVDALGDYLATFVTRSLGVGFADTDNWPMSWTVFYWANWLSWAPIVALFLGKIAKGYTVRDFIIVNWCIPALFSILWMSIFSGTILTLDFEHNGAFYQLLNSSGPGAVIYGLLDQLPLSALLIMVFVAVAFLAYVTAADSNTEAIATLCMTKDVTEKKTINLQTYSVQLQSAAVKRRLKILWGVIIATIAWVMTAFSGIDGIKMMSNLGGFPALLVVLLMNFALLRAIFTSLKVRKEQVPAM